MSEGATMTTELKPCPFCGSKAFLTEHEPHKHFLVPLPDHHGSWTIECVKCECGMIADEKADVLAAWNRRAAPEPVAAPVQGDVQRARALASNPDNPSTYEQKRADAIAAEFAAVRAEATAQERASIIAYAKAHYEPIDQSVVESCINRWEPERGKPRAARAIRRGA